METPNLAYIKEISGGDVEFEQSIIAVLKKEFPEEVKSFQGYFDNKNYLEAANLVHKIKHKISILGLKEGLRIATNFETQLKKAEVALYSEFVNILNKIHVYLNGL